MHLRHQLQTLKKGSLSVNDYVVKMKGIADALTSSSQVVTEYDLVSCILEGFGQEFDPVVVTITAKKEDIT